MLKYSTNNYNHINFVGDFSAPSWALPDLCDFNKWLSGGALVVNLEGPVLKPDIYNPVAKSSLKVNLASSSLALQQFDKSKTFFSVANNHFEDFDTAHCLDLSENGFNCFGESNNYLKKITLNYKDVFIFSFAFPSTDPGRWRTRRNIHILDPRNAISILRRYRKRFPEALLACYIHWGYELNSHPYPADRAWARQAAALGVDLIIGHHPHVTQTVEWFGETPVIYSLGNFFLPEGRWFAKQLSYKGNANAGLAVRYDGKKIQLYATSVINGGIRTSRFNEEMSLSISNIYNGMSDSEYRVWFSGLVKTKKIKTPKFLPILKDYRTAFGFAANLFFLFQDVRQIFRDLLVATRIHKPYQ